MKKGYVVLLVFLTALTLVSLGVSSATLYGLMRARQIAVETLADARVMLGGMGSDTFSYTIVVNQEIPIAASVPFSERVSVPIQTTLPISTVVSVPINAGLLGTFDVDVPVRTLIPVDLEVVVPVSQTLDIATTVSLDTAVPVEIPISDTPFSRYLGEIDAALESAELELSWPDILGNLSE